MPALETSVLKSYLNKYPTTPTLTLAKIICEEHSGINTETIRAAIRYHRGALGKESRVKNNGEYYWQNDWIKYKATLAEKRKEGLSPFKLPNRKRKVLLLSDLHFPFVDDVALHHALDYGVKMGIDTIYLNGDVIDFKDISRYKDRRLHTTKFELEQVRGFFGLLRNIFPTAEIYYKMGNHEDRFESYLLLNAEKVLDIPEFQLEYILQFDNFNIQKIASKQLAYIGKLAVIHGHEYRMINNPVNPARGLILRAKESTLMSHLHQGSKHSGKTISGQIITCWSTPCLCDLNPLYHVWNEWGHGFAYIEVEQDGSFLLAIKDVIKGKLF